MDRTRITYFLIIMTMRYNQFLYCCGHLNVYFQCLSIVLNHVTGVQKEKKEGRKGERERREGRKERKRILVK